MKLVFNINNNIPAHCRPWLDGREFITVSHHGVLHFWDAPNNSARSSRISSVVETDNHFVMWAVDSDDGEVRGFTVSKPLTPENALEWVTEEQLFRYLTPVDWWKDVDPQVDTLAEAYLLGMPDSVRGGFVEWAKSLYEDRYPNQREVLEWVSTHY